MSIRRVDYWHDPNAPEPTTRKPSASTFVRDDIGHLLLLRRVDNELWTIPTGGVQKGETVGQAGIRECREETGLHVQVTGLVGIFSTPDHVIAYMQNDHMVEARQPINICLRAHVVSGTVEPQPDEASEVRWVDPEHLNDYPIHPALLERIHHGLTSTEPYIA